MRLRLMGARRAGGVLRSRRAGVHGGTVWTSRWSAPS